MMNGKIIDKSHFNFHVDLKSKLLNAYLRLKQGGAFVDVLSSLHLTTDKNLLKNAEKDPAITALLEILEEYKAAEPRSNRKDVVVAFAEAGISLMANDLFWKERGYWFIHQIIKRHASFRQCAYFPPHTWYPNMRKTGGDTCEKPIDEEYQDWYHIDLQAELDAIPDDLQEKIIAEGVAWLQENDPAAYHQFSIKKI